MLAVVVPAAHLVAAAWLIMPGTVDQQFVSPVAPVGSESLADTNWSRLYRTDLDSLRAFIAANHPGAVDRQNPEFARTLATAYLEALRDTSIVTSHAAYAVALARFGNRFQDAHLVIASTRPVGEVREAGIYTVYRGGGFMIAEADARYGPLATALLGATVLGCGREDARQLFASRVLSWRGRPDVAADWYRFAPLLFTDYGPPTPPAPESCRFAIADRTIEIPLQWRPAPDTTVRRRQLALTGMPARPLAVSRLDSGRTIWVDLPTFSVTGDAEVANMRAMIDSLAAALKAKPRWTQLVFDLRGNSGGSSAWGDAIAKAVYGKAWHRQAVAWLGDGVYTEWRVSPFTVNAVGGLVRQVESRHGTDSDDAKRLRALRDSMAAALERGDSLYGVTQRRRNVKPPPATKLPGRVLLLTSASCFSACLDFLDRMRLHPSAVQVGQTTGVDTDYMENWGARLPSGLVSISFPMKVYRNRRRAHNAAYAPTVPYGGAIEDTDAVRAWIARRNGEW
jgi:hypothetical protein